MSLRIILSASNSVLKQCSYKINTGETSIGRIKPFLCPKMSFSTENHPIVSYEQLKKSTESKNTCIIDVREPDELAETGTIPNSINIPLGEVEEALKNLSNEQFLKRYGREKPAKDFEVIFSCKMGKRSGQAQVLSQQLGYKNVKNYLGGWLDWEQQIKN